MLRVMPLSNSFPTPLRLFLSFGPHLGKKKFSFLVAMEDWRIRVDAIQERFLDDDNK